jgi:hypothetical protein
MSKPPTCPHHPGYRLRQIEVSHFGQARQLYACGCAVDGYPEPDALGLFVAACLGTGAPGEPTPLDALDSLLAAAQIDLACGSPPVIEREDVEAVERLARELRAACAECGRAEGEGPC